MVWERIDLYSMFCLSYILYEIILDLHSPPLIVTLMLLVANFANTK